MLLVMEKLRCDKDAYQEAIHWIGQQSRFNEIGFKCIGVSPTKPNDLTILNCTPKLQFLDKTLTSNSEKQHPTLYPF